MTAPVTGHGQRLDVWLFCARFAKSRGIAADLVKAGGVRLNGQPMQKPAHMVRPGDTLTVPFAGTIRVIRVEAMATRRGPAEEARTLYTDLTSA